LFAPPPVLARWELPLLPVPVLVVLGVGRRFRALLPALAPFDDDFGPDQLFLLGVSLERVVRPWVTLTVTATAALLCYLLASLLTYQTKPALFIACNFFWKFGSASACLFSFVCVSMSSVFACVEGIDSPIF
tara:strand:- start:11200 stop:11595 length:396 start_codon:yes stop_codon:yes gene_type:complete